MGGLGLPWSVGAFYWYFQGATEEWKKNVSGPECGLSRWRVRCGRRNSGSFCWCLHRLRVELCLAPCCKTSLFGRRAWSHKASAYASAACLVALWFVYIGMSIYIEVQ